jgi:hypothetical protein
MKVIQRIGVLAAVFGLLLASEASADRASSNSPSRDRTYPFAIRGDVTGLYPGATKQYLVMLTNPNSFAIVVGEVSVRTDRGARGCGTQNLSSPGFRGSVLVPSHGSAAVTVPMTMSSKAPNQCQGVQFALTYSGWGRRP